MENSYRRREKKFCFQKIIFNLQKEKNTIKNGKFIEKEFIFLHAFKQLYPADIKDFRPVRIT